MRFKKGKFWKEHGSASKIQVKPERFAFKTEELDMKILLFKTSAAQLPTQQDAIAK